MPSAVSGRSCTTVSYHAVLPKCLLSWLPACLIACLPARLYQALESSLAEAFDVSRDNQCITITSSLPSGGDVGGVWAAMELAGSLQKHMQSVAGRRSDTGVKASDSQGYEQTDTPGVLQMDVHGCCGGK